MFDTRTKAKNKNHFKNGGANKLACHNLIDGFLEST